VAPVQTAPVASEQGRPLQQSEDWVQTWPGAVQVAPGWQVPLAAPPGMVQLVPRQQSDEAVQVPPWGWQEGGAVHEPATQ
jgi:hypothetical protein